MRREPTWPISANTIRIALRRMDIPPVEHPPGIKVLASSGKYEWVRFEVSFSRLAIERLPMEVDEKTNLYLSDEARLARQIRRSFMEPLSDMSIVRSKWHYVVTFTIYTTEPIGMETYEQRKARPRLPWNEWVRDFE